MVRYRVLNQLGWSDYSDATTFIAADVPSKTTPVKISGISSTQILLDFDLYLVDNGGLPLNDYILEAKSDIETTYTQITAYGGQPQYALTTTDGLVVGRIYSLRWYAAN